MEILLSTGYTLFFIFLILRYDFFKPRGLAPRAGILLFAFKLIAGVAVGLIYTYYYTDRHTADTFRLFDDSQIVFNTIHSSWRDFFSIMTGIGGDSPHLGPIYNSMNNWYDIYSPINDNRFMIRFNAALRFISMGHYYVHVVIVAFLSTSGTIALFRFLQTYLSDCSKALFLAIGFLPSVLFWGSGLMKDAMVVFALGFTLYFFGRLLSAPGNRIKMIFFVIALLVLTFSRFQIMVLTLPALSAWWISVRFPKHGIVAFPGMVALVTALFFLLSGVYSDIDLSSLLYNKQQSFIRLATEAGAGSMIKPIKFAPYPSDVLLHAPLGFATTLLRPFITDSGNPLLVMSGIENLFILLLGIYCMLDFRKNFRESSSLLLFSIWFVVISFSVIGLVTPVLGAMVRYKTPALPLLLVVFLLLANPKKRLRLNALAGMLPI
ncbi:MAG TPA: hypothetical protein VFW78_01120 [Bacteroidia bacterium]|nr:hypothetical protein [Bacteroidia bacterium]